MNSLKQAVADAVQGEPRILDDEISVLFQLSEDFLGFQGHFPSKALLPAFVQILMGRHVLQRWLDKPLRLSLVDRAKFKMPIGPGEVTVSCKQHEDGYLTHLYTADGLASSFVLFIEPRALKTPGEDAA